MTSLTLLDHERRRVSALTLGQEVPAGKRQGEDQVGRNEHRPKSCSVCSPGVSARSPCHSPAEQPTNGRQNRRDREAGQKLQPQRKIIGKHRSPSRTPTIVSSGGKRGYPPASLA